VYGYDFLTAGQKTMTLLSSKGWTAWINDDLVARVLALASWVVGAGTGTLVLFTYNPLWIQDYYHSTGYNGSSSSSDDDAQSGSWGLCFLLPMIIGTAVANLVVTIVASACDTVLVTFCEAPLDFERNHPALHRQLLEAWQLVYPEERQQYSAPT